MKNCNWKRKTAALLAGVIFIATMSSTTLASTEETNITSNEAAEERVVQIAIPDENGIMQFFTGDEAQAIYNQIESETNKEIPSEQPLPDPVTEGDDNEGISTRGMFTYKYRFVTTAKGTKWGNIKRISSYACNGTSVQQSITLSASTTVSWGINASLSGKFKKAFTAAVGLSWSKNSSFRETLTINVPSKKRVWLEFKPRWKYIKGEAQKYYVTRGPKPVTIIKERKQVSSSSPTTIRRSLGGRTVSCPDGAYIWKEDKNYKMR